MPDKRRVAPVSWRGGGAAAGGGGGATGGGSGGGRQVGSSTERVVASESITGVTPYRMVFTASTTSSNTILLPWPGSVVGIGFYGGATGGGTFTVYLDGEETDAALEWVSASTGDSETFAAGTYPFDAGEFLSLRSSNTQTADVYVYVTFLS